jgi:Protein of unknown function (DUF3604)
MRLRIAICGIVMLSACSKPEPPPPPPAAPAATQAAPALPKANPDRNAYFGDLHVHTGLSFDAYVFGVRATPDDAYRYAKGKIIKHPAGFDMQLKHPLDFEAVTDHSEYLGMLEAMQDPNSKPGQHPIGKQMREAKTPEQRALAFREVVKYLRGLRGDDDLLDPAVVRSAWQRSIESAERNNDPGTFTTFVAYEYTSSGTEQQNLHRNVIFRGSDVPDQVFTALDSTNPERLWAWMDAQRVSGTDVLAIPHNSNGSDGMMFELTNTAGEPIDAAYAAERMKNEPLVEVTQVKGTSDTHPIPSPNDEWANFEIMPLRVASDLPSKPQGSYVREAYLNGLAMQVAQGFNPYRFGLIGSSDTHVAAGPYDEAHYWSKVGLLDATPQQRGSVPLDKPNPDGSIYSTGYFQYWSASGLAGVWAEQNTRDAIFAALARKETFATSGPRMRVRFFAGFGLNDGLLDDPNPVHTAYANGVPMGADLVARDAAAVPAFFVWAMRDPDSAPLQRLQVIKGWVTGGKAHERVFDVACSVGSVDAATQRCPDNGATVDLATCAYSPEVGANELRTVWRDPTFDPAQQAFYYVRALENPTCRWSTWDAIRAGVSPRPDLPTTIQERVWSSPIWLQPVARVGYVSDPFRGDGLHEGRIRIRPS